MKGRSVPASWVTWYCIGVRRFLSSSLLSILVNCLATTSGFFWSEIRSDILSDLYLRWSGGIYFYTWTNSTPDRPLACTFSHLNCEGKVEFTIQFFNTLVQCTAFDHWSLSTVYWSSQVSLTGITAILNRYTYIHGRTALPHICEHNLIFLIPLECLHYCCTY